MSLVTLWRDYKRPLPDIPFPLVINLLKGQAVILWIAVLMTLIGWGRLSILVCVHMRRWPCACSRRWALCGL